MILGIVTTYDSDTESGEITDNEGRTLDFYYHDGQNMEIGNDFVAPQLTGHHEQPEGYILKAPMIGDPVAFNGEYRVETWGYARHFVDLAERQYGTIFTT